MRRRLLPSLLSHRFLRNSSLLRLSAPSVESNAGVTFDGAMVESVFERYRGVGQGINNIQVALFCSGGLTKTGT